MLRQVFRFSSWKNVQDIITNFTPKIGCDRIKQIGKQAYLSAVDSTNGDHYSNLTDLLSFAAAKRMHQKMQAHPVGKRILEEKPRITDDTFYSLANLPEGTFGKQYYNFMNSLNFKPSQRPVVKYIQDLQYAYVLQRYKQIHDFLHTLFYKQVSVDEQLIIKWFQMRQLRLPSATLASLISPFMSSKFELREISKVIRIADKSEFMMNIYFEQQFGTSAVTNLIFQEQVRIKYGFK